MRKKRNVGMEPEIGVDRLARVNEILKREIADRIESMGINEGSGLISVTKVEVSSCLKDASVYVSILGADPEREQKILREIARRKSELQSAVAKHVILKYTPVLHFVQDRNIAEGDRVLARIREIEEEEKSHENQ